MTSEVTFVNEGKDHDLLVAAANGNLEEVEAFVAEGIDVNISSSEHSSNVRARAAG